MSWSFQYKVTVITGRMSDGTVVMEGIKLEFGEHSDADFAVTVTMSVTQETIETSFPGEVCGRDRGELFEKALRI